MTEDRADSSLPKPERLLVHVGLPKSGTSYLQSVLRNNSEVLAGQGVALVPPKRAGSFQVVLQIRGKLREADGPAAHRALDRFERQLRRCTAPTALLTQEALAPTTPEQAEALLARAGDREVHVVVTARDFARQLPSAWQQRIKDRHTYSFVDLVTAIRNGEEPALDLWRNQDLPRIIESWSSVTAPERVHLVTSPRPGSDGSLLERFCQVLGVDHTKLDLGSVRRNAALGYAQAELLRQVNVALDDRLQSVRHGYGRVGKKWLAEQVLLRQDGRPVRLPESMRGWCTDLSAQWIADIQKSGCQVVGDLDDLKPADTAFGDVPEPTAEELLAVATRALADILEERHDGEKDQAEGGAAR